MTCRSASRTGRPTRRDPSRSPSPTAGRASRFAGSAPASTSRSMSRPIPGDTKVFVVEKGGGVLTLDPGDRGQGPLHHGDQHLHRQ